MVKPGPRQGPTPGGSAPANAAAAPFAACSDGGPPPDLSGMTSRVAADRLYNRVMTFLSQADTTCASMFMPMAIAAYNQAQPLDHDGLFHLSLLNKAAGNLDDALSDAQQVLKDDPDHVLALGAAAEAEVALGRNSDAAKHYQHLLDVYDAQKSRSLPEYQDHQQTMTALQSEAKAFLAGR
jgi:tetratricopeptide (TPR) repeat protein